MFGAQKKEDDCLDSFLNEADSVLTPATLRTRAKSGCEYSTYLSNPTSHHGQALLKGTLGKEKPKPLPFGVDSKGEQTPIPVKTPAPTPLKIKKKDNLMKEDLNARQIKMEKRMSHPSAGAMAVLWKLGDSLEMVQKEILDLRNVPDKPIKLIKAKQDLAVLNSRLDALSLEGIDEVVTAELKSGRTEAREERKRLTALAEETHELVHVLSLELKNRLSNSGPEVKLAWKYYQKYTLPNRVLKEGTKHEFRKLEPGETVPGSELYGIFDTPVNELGDFGIGILLYFKMLRFLGVLVVILGGAAAYNINYFDSTDYSANGQAVLPTVSVMRGSAVCDTYQAVCAQASGCGTCSISAAGVASGDGCVAIKSCEFTPENAYVMLGIAGAFLIANLVMGWQHWKIEVEADEAEQTAQDYSVMVNDPDPDAVDPDEWQKFFSQFGHVAYVTVALTNGKLLTLMAERRAVLRRLGFENGVNKTPDEQIQFDAEENTRLYNKLSFLQKRSLGLVQQRHRLLELDAAIQKEAVDGKFVATKVFIVFETEESQRRCLQQMTVGTIPAALDIVGDLRKHLIFRGTNVLDICEAPEPTDVIWENLETPFKHQVIEQTVTNTLSLGIVALCGYLIYAIHEAGMPGLAAIFISVTNSVMPTALKAINEQEEHLTQGSKQTSLLLKLVVLRWMTTGFIVLLVRDVATTLDEEFIKKIWAILLADALTTPCLRLLDPGSRLGRYYFSKKAETQEKMNSYFLGTSWFLAERYTDMTKTIFVSLFFAAIFPQGLFVTAVAFFVSYWVDMYCLFRLWKQPPAMDGSLADAARVQISLVLLAHTFVTHHFFRGWPFDGYEPTGSYVGGVPLYEKTDLQSKYNVFDWSRGKWMSDEQARIVLIYAIVNIAAVSVFAVYYFGHSFKYGVHKLIWGSYVSVGDARQDEYSFVPGIQTYVPMVSHKSLGLPLIATELQKLDTEHICFTMKSAEEYDRDNLVNSNAFRGNVSNQRRRGLFSICKQYKSQKLMDWEIENVEVDMATIHEWERETMLKTKKVLRGGIEEVGAMGKMGGVKIGSMKSLDTKNKEKASKSSMLNAGPENYEL